jgi:hypothetical protein
MTVRDQLASLIRTWVPIGVGFVLALLARKFGVVLDEASSAALTAGIAALASAVFYGVVRILESRWKPVGWLLGLAVSPQYESKAVGSGSDNPTAQNGAESVPKLDL